ncbi:hypothetical protein H6761_02930 [Candidatus Nomurabacteria bacterium]|nr:hypothetical protein [Candidatus Nomurabacteria bacterium]
MNPKIKLFWLQVVMVVIALTTFFITKGMSGDPASLLIAAIAVMLAAAIVAMLAAAIVAPAASAAIAAAIAAIAAAPAASTAIAAIAAAIVAAIVAMLAGSYYTKRQNLTKGYVFLSLVAELIIIATPMIWYIVTHQGQIKTAMIGH